MKPDERLRDQWMWNQGQLRVASWVPIVVAGVVTAASYPRFGTDALYFLLFGLRGPLFRAIYGVVGRKVQAVKATLVVGDGDLAESLMVIGKTQAPGVAILREGELLLAPIVGERRTIPLDDIVSVRETGNMFGKGFVWKRAFILEVPGTPRLAFAVPTPVARRWAIRLSRTRQR